MADFSVQSTAETDSDFGEGEEGTAARYLAEIDLFEAETKDYLERGRKIIERYRDERNDVVRNVPRFALLWSNIQTTLPIYYAQTPKADVQRRFKDQDPVGRVACQIAERALDYSIECDDRFDRTMRQAVEDFALVGRGLSWQRYVPHFRGIDQRVDLKASWEMGDEGLQVSNETSGDEADGYLSDPDGNKFGVEEAERDEVGFYINRQTDILDYEETIDDHVNWEDFGHNSGARVWEEAYIIWRKVYMTRDELHARFDATYGKDEVSEIPLDYEPKAVGKYPTTVKDLFRKACVYEMWDKSKLKVAWVHKACKKPLDCRDDPLHLSEFYPCPKPIFATMTSNTLIPIPDFAQYQDQAGEIDNVTSRIKIIEKAIKVRGLYPGNVDAVRQLLANADENDMIALDQASISSIMNNGGNLDKIVYFWPVDILVKCLEVLIKLRTQLIEDVYQITGFGDILRGVSAPRETATTSRVKSQWGSLRVNDRQREIQRFARDCLRIKFEIIFNHYEDDTIWKIASAENIPEIGRDQSRGTLDPNTMQPNLYGVVFSKALALLRDSSLRAFRVDIETDSTMAPDDASEKQAFTEYLGALGAFFQQVAPVLQNAPEFAPYFGEVLMRGGRLFKAASSMESTLESAVAQFTQKAMQPKPPTPEQQAAQVKAQSEQMRAQADMQIAQMDGQTAQVQGAVKAHTAQVQGAVNTQRAQQDLVVSQQEHGMTMQQMDAEHAMKMQQLAAQNVVQLTRPQGGR